MLVQSTFSWYFRIPEVLSLPLDSLDFNFSSDHSDPIFLQLNLDFLESLAIYFSTSYFWCVISRSRSRGGRMITSLNWISIHLESYLLGAFGSHLMFLSLGASHHLGHHVPLFLTSLSPISSTSYADQVIKAYNISDLSQMDRYQDSLNPDS